MEGRQKREKDKQRGRQKREGEGQGERGIGEVGAEGQRNWWEGGRVNEINQVRWRKKGNRRGTGKIGVMSRG